MKYDAKQGELLALTADIVSSHVSNNSVAVSDLPTLINGVYNKLTELSGVVAVAETPKLTPAVPVKASVKPDYVVCLEDGKKQKMLKRHLMTAHDLTPDEYRAKWKLPADYPMVSPSYAATRRELAIKIGLGRPGAAGKKAGRPKIGLAKK